MRKKEWFMVLAAAGLLAVYVVYFTDWFKPQTLHIFHTTRSTGMARRNRPSAAPTLTFGFDGSRRLTEIEVVPVAALATNAHPTPLWHLVSSSNSIPCKSFRYGANIRGLQPLVPGSRAKPLETNVAYRIFISAGRAKGQHDFTLGGD